LASPEPALALQVGGCFSLGERARIAAYVELEVPGNHHDGRRSISVLGTHEPERGIAIHKEAAAIAPRVLNHPVSAAVLANHEIRPLQPRGRFCLFCFGHGRSPLKILRLTGIGSG